MFNLRYCPSYELDHYVRKVGDQEATRRYPHFSGTVDKFEMHQDTRTAYRAPDACTTSTTTAYERYSPLAVTIPGGTPLTVLGREGQKR